MQVVRTVLIMFLAAVAAIGMPQTLLAQDRVSYTAMSANSLSPEAATLLLQLRSDKPNLDHHPMLKVDGQNFISSFVIPAVDVKDGKRVAEWRKAIERLRVKVVSEGQQWTVLIPVASFEALVAPEARVAFLCHSTKGSAKHPFVDKVTSAVAIAKERYPDVLLDGELQLDAAIIPEVAARKAPGSPVAGSPNTLIFPNINAGNIGYKLMQRFGGFEAYGPIFQGFAKPVSDLSRGCNTTDIVYTALGTINKK